MLKAYDKTIKVIESITDIKYFPATKNMILNFWFLFKDEYYYRKLYVAYYAKHDEFVWF